jgi:hypothetical protein
MKRYNYSVQCGPRIPEFTHNHFLPQMAGNASPVLTYGSSGVDATGPVWHCEPLVVPVLFL